MIRAVKRFASSLRNAVSAMTGAASQSFPWGGNWLSTANPFLFFSDWIGPTRSKQTVTHDTAFQATTVFNCVRIIAEETAMLPLKFYRDNPDGTRELVADSVPQQLLRNPNPWQTEYEFREFMAACLAWRGNAYARIMPGRSMLIPLHPGRVRPELLKDGRVVYHVQPNEGGPEKTYQQFEILHYRGLSKDGVVGMSVIQIARETIGLDMAAVDHAGTFFGNRAKPGGFITSKVALSDTARAQLQEDIAKFASSEYRDKTPAFPFDLDWKQIGLSNKDTQWLESRKFTRAEIAALWRVPLHMVNDLDGAKYNNMELQDLALLKHTLMPYLVRIEQRNNHTLVYDVLQEERGLFCEHLAEGLLRGDSKTRSEVYRTALGGPGTGRGWYSINEVRRKENLPPLDDPRADEVYLGEPPQQTADPAANQPPADPYASVKNQMDAGSIGVRSGWVTPQQEDEDFFREQLGLPNANGNVREVWTEEPTRRPVTLAAPKGGNSSNPPPSNNSPPDNPPPAQPAGNQIDPTLQIMLEDAARRLFKIEQRNVLKRMKHAPDDPDRFSAWCEDWYWNKFTPLAAKELASLAAAADCAAALESIAKNYGIARCDLALRAAGNHGVALDEFHNGGAATLCEELRQWQPQTACN